MASQSNCGYPFFYLIILIQKLNMQYNDRNRIRTHNQLVHKRTLNYFAKMASLAKWLSVRSQTKWLWV